MMSEHLEYAVRILTTHSQIIEKDNQKAVQAHFKRQKILYNIIAFSEKPLRAIIARSGFSYFFTKKLILDLLGESVAPSHIPC